MHRYILLKTALLCLTRYSCFAQQLPKLGTEWKITVKEKHLIHVPIGFMPMSVLTINNVKYTIGVDKQTHMVSYIGTQHPGFTLNGSTVIGRLLSSFKSKNNLKLI